MAQGLQTVLGLVQQHGQLCVYWTLNYGIEEPALRMHLLDQLRKTRCVPATPVPVLCHLVFLPVLLSSSSSPWNLCIQEWSRVGFGTRGLDYHNRKSLLYLRGLPGTSPRRHWVSWAKPRSPSQPLLSPTPTSQPPALPPRPLVLDPADPTWNVGQGSWQLLAREATALEKQICHMSGAGTAVEPWDVMVRG